MYSPLRISVFFFLFHVIASTHLSPVIKKFISRVVRENHHKTNGFVLIGGNKVEPNYLDFAAKEITNYSSVVILRFDQHCNLDIPISPTQFKVVVVNPDAHGCRKIFKKIQASRARVVLIFTKKPHPIVVEYLFTSYSKMQNVNIVVAHEEGDGIQAVTYNPYSPQKIESITDELFYEKSRNLYGTEVRSLLTYDDRTKIKKSPIGYHGKDFLTVNTIISHLNGKVEVVDMPNVLLNPWFESSLFPDSEAQKVKILTRKKISILIKSEQFSVNDKVFDNLYPHAQNDLTILVPKSKKVPIFRSVTLMYNFNVWLTILFVNLLVIAVGCVMKKFRKNTVSRRSWFSVLRILITSSTYPIPPYCLERLFIISWVVTAFLINTFSQSKFTSYMAVRRYFPEINTIEEVSSLQFPLYALPYHIDEVQKKYRGTDYEPWTNSFLMLATNEGLMDQAIYRTDVDQMPVFLMEHDIALYISRCKNCRKNGAQMYHMVKESIVPNYQSYKVVHNSPLLPILNKNLRRLEEGGFIDLWGKRTIYNATVEGFLLPANFDDGRCVKALDVGMFQAWFEILALGYSLATVAFLVEISVYKMKISSRGCLRFLKKRGEL